MIFQSAQEYVYELYFNQPNDGIVLLCGLDSDFESSKEK